MKFNWETGLESRKCGKKHKTGYLWAKYAQFLFLFSKITTIAAALF
jgi:hypothetical protein